MPKILDDGSQNPGGVPTEIPDNASDRAKKMWSGSVLHRIRDLLFPTEETTETYAAAMFESFNDYELAQFIREDRNLIQLVIRAGRLDNKFIAPWAKVIIRRNAKPIYSALVGWPEYPDTGPAGIVRRADMTDKRKAEILRTPEGWKWLSWSCYRLALFFQEYAEIKNWPLVLPPPLPDPSL